MCTFPPALVRMYQGRTKHEGTRLFQNSSTLHGLLNFTQTLHSCSPPVHNNGIFSVLEENWFLRRHWQHTHIHLVHRRGSTSRCADCYDIQSCGITGQKTRKVHMYGAREGGKISLQSFSLHHYQTADLQCNPRTSQDDVMFPNALNFAAMHSWASLV